MSKDAMNENKRICVTPELALAAAKVLFQYCDDIGSCEECKLKEYFNCEREPYYWNIPETGIKVL